MATNKTVTVTTIPTLTGDTVASYNIYEGVSGTTLLGTMTPAEAAAGKVFAFTDGIVHSVKCQTVWTTAGASTLRSTGVPLDLSGGGSIIVMQDDFAGVTIDTGKWAVTDPADIIDISQNEDIIFTTTATSLLDHSINYIDGLNSFSGGVDTQCFQINNVNFDATNASLRCYPTFRFWDGTNDNKIEITKDSVTGNDFARIIVKVGGVTAYSFISAIAYKDNRFKIEVTATEQKFYYWSGAAWTQIGVTQTEDFTGVTLKPLITAQTQSTAVVNSSCGATGVFQTNDTYTTISPT